MEEEEELAFRLRLLHLVGLTQKEDVNEVLRFAHEELAFRVQDKVLSPSKATLLPLLNLPAACLPQRIGTSNDVVSLPRG